MSKQPYFVQSRRSRVRITHSGTAGRQVAEHRGWLIAVQPQPSNFNLRATLSPLPPRDTGAVRAEPVRRAAIAAGLADRGSGPTIGGAGVYLLVDPRYPVPELFAVLIDLIDTVFPPYLVDWDL